MPIHVFTAEPLPDRVRHKGEAPQTFQVGGTRWASWRPLDARTPVGSWTVTEEASTFIDKYQPRGAGIWPFKPCTHTYVKRTNCRPYPYNGTIPAGCPVGSAYKVGDSVTSLYGASYFLLNDQTFIEGVNPITNSDWTRVGKKWEDLLPSLQGDSPDLFVFLKEARDILTLVESRVIQLSVAGAIDALAREHLVNAFVLRPLVGDILSINKRLLKARTHFTELVAASNKKITRHCRVNIPTKTVQKDFVPITPQWCVEGSSSVACPVRAGYTDFISQGHVINVTGAFIYEMPPMLNVLSDQIFRVLQSWDLDLDLDALWEMLPFSFVIDWFFNTYKIFSWLKNTDPDEIKVTLSDMSVSVKSYSILMRRLHWPCFTGDHEFIVESGSYTRTVGPDALSSLLPWFKMPSFMQFSYGAALMWLLLRSR
jgi:hypothetical protein